MPDDLIDEREMHIRAHRIFTTRLIKPEPGGREAWNN